MKKPVAFAIISIVVIFVAGAIIWKVTRPTLPENTVVIGAVLPLSGPVAFLGEGTVNGLKLAEEHANAGKWGTSPIMLRVLAADGAGIPRTSIGAYRKLTDSDGARIVITTLSGVSMALKPLADQEGVLLFANASHPDITTDVQMVFRHSNTASQEAAVIL